MNKAKLINKKKLPLIIGISAILIILVAFFIVWISLSGKKNNKKLNIAFYNLPSETEQALKDNVSSIINEGEKGSVKFVEITDLEEFNKKNFSKKYDMLFTWKGQITKNLEKDSKTVSSKVLDYLPSSVKKKSEKQLPVLLSSYEIAYNQQLLSKRKNIIPSSVTELEGYIYSLKSHVFSPFICQGGDNRTLINLFLALAEGYGGKKAYDNFVNACKNYTDFDTFLQTKLYDETDAEKCKTIEDMLQILVKWQKDGLVHPSWYIATKSDVEFFMETKETGVVFESLEQHRATPFKLINDFESSRFPFEDENIDHAFIAPEVVCMDFLSSANTKKIMHKLVSEDVQENLSMVTTYAPVALRGASYDVQADDVRFFAASCAAGPVPDIYDAVFQKNSEKFENICAEIREYIRKNESK